MVCFLCRENGLNEFLNLGNQPLANKYPQGETDFEREEFFSLTVFFCNNCRNVQLGTLISRERMFEDYYYLSSVNPGLVSHFEQFGKEIAVRGANFVVDVGSNDGILLKPLKELGIKAIGVDPSINVSKIANDAGLETITAFFNTETAEMIKTKYQKSDLIIASSVFTHLEDPHQFIGAVKNLMTDDGRFIIEVEYIGNILRDVQFERFYLDRIFYYSLTSLKSLLAMHGMHIAEAEIIEPHGGSLRVTARPGQNQITAEPVLQLLKEEEVNLTPARLKNFKEQVNKHTSDFRNKLLEYKKDKIKVAGYGAPARVATICNYSNIGPDLIKFIIDDSPLKQNKFSPGTHIPIVPKNFLENSAPDVLVVFAHEYLDSIKEKTGGKYRYLIPIPPREV